MTTVRTFYRLAMFMVPVLCVVTPVSADDAGFYLGARLGLAQYPTKSRLILSPSLELHGRTDDNEDLTWSFDAGYRFNHYVGIEAGFVDLGEASGRLTDGADAAAIVSFAAKGATLALTGTFPLGNWEPYVKAGVFFSDTRLAFSGSAAGTSFAATVSGSGTDGLYGAGVGYNCTDRWQAKFDLTYFREAGESETGHSEVLSLTAGFIWRF